MNTVDSSIKPVASNEVTLLQTISRQTFAETFSTQNTEEDIKKYLEENLSLDQLSNELANPDSRFYFAWQNEAVIGYLKLNFGQAQTELKDANAVEIERIYILKEFYGKQIGQLLYRKALEVGIQEKATYIWLGVWERNERALAFYKKNGFIAFDKHLFKLGADQQTDILMKRALSTTL